MKKKVIPTVIAYEVNNQEQKEAVIEKERDQVFHKKKFTIESDQNKYPVQQYNSTPKKSKIRVPTIFKVDETPNMKKKKIDWDEIMNLLYEVILLGAVIWGIIEIILFGSVLEIVALVLAIAFIFILFIALSNL